jgi:5'-nucleotidase (lipoprotein e(P4) family)
VQNHSIAWGLAAAGLAAGLVIGYLAAPDPAPANVAQRDLGADLYVQTSAEYNALCRQTYRYAYECLQRRLADPPKGELPFAVVMDLDETVFDNSGYLSWLYRSGQKFDYKTWAVWEEKYADEVKAVPGAVEFIHKAEAIKKPSEVKVIYLSNRRNKAGALAALRGLELDNRGDAEQRLIVRTDGRDKEPRRQEVARKYRVLLLIGDNLSDLSSDFATKLTGGADFTEQADAVNARKKKVEQHADRFGYDWIILPNPVYGDWNEALGSDPAQHLRQTNFTPAGPVK